MSSKDTERIVKAETRLDNHDEDIDRLDKSKAPLDRFVKIEGFVEKFVWLIVSTVLLAGLALILKQNL